MTTTCTRCGGTGFLNIEQVPDCISEQGYLAVLNWIDEQDALAASKDGCTCHISPPCEWCILQHDVQVCDCCGDGSEWYGTPGEHYGPDDPPGHNGPYKSNGGLCLCH